MLRGGIRTVDPPRPLVAEQLAWLVVSLVEGQHAEEFVITARPWTGSLYLGFFGWTTYLLKGPFIDNL